MVRAPGGCDRAWTAEEDCVLLDAIETSRNDAGAIDWPYVHATLRAAGVRRTGTQGRHRFGRMKAGARKVAEGHQTQRCRICGKWRLGHSCTTPIETLAESDVEASLLCREELSPAFLTATEVGALLKLLEKDDGGSDAVELRADDAFADLEPLSAVNKDLWPYDRFLRAE